MGFAGIDHAFELRVGEQPVGQHGRRQMRPVAGFGRRDRGHRRRLHEARRMRLRSGNADRLQDIALIERLGDAGALCRRPIAGLVSELGGLVGNRRDAVQAWRRRDRPLVLRTRRRGCGCARPENPRRTARGGTSRITQSSRVAASGAMPGEAGNAAGSSAGTRSITVSRVSTVVPWRA